MVPNKQQKIATFIENVFNRKHFSIENILRGNKWALIYYIPYNLIYAWEEEKKMQDLLYSQHSEKLITMRSENL